MPKRKQQQSKQGQNLGGHYKTEIQLMRHDCQHTEHIFYKSFSPFQDHAKQKFCDLLLL